MYYKFILSIFLFLSICVYANAFTQQDDLEKILHKSSGVDKLITLRNLADLNFDTPKERQYLISLYKEADAQSNKEFLGEALSELTMSYLVSKSLDSARICIDKIINKIEKPLDRDRLVCYLNMRLFELEFVSGDTVSIESNLKSLKAKQNSNIYTQIEYAYHIGISLEIRKQYAEAIPYLETAYNLVHTLDPKIAFVYNREIVRRLSICYINLKQSPKSVAMIEQLMQMQNNYYEQSLKKERPFYPIKSLQIRNYSSLFMNSRYLSTQQITTHLESLKSIYSSDLNMYDRYSYFLSLNNIYLSTGKYNDAISANDSLIMYAKSLAPYNLPGLYNINAIIYEYIKNYKSALYFSKLSSKTKDSIDTSKANEQLAKMQVEYDVNKVNYEKSILEIRSKKILLIVAVSGLLLVVLICFYLYYNLKKERMRKKEMAILKDKAEESEKLKTAFIQSISHEIRTPLNAISGFSGLILDETLDDESRQIFQYEIAKNTEVLSSLINSMLEVSVLDISDEKLPCSPVNVKDICDHSMNMLLNNKKDNIKYILDIQQTDLIISTNNHYLGLVLENILINANNFTDSGSIELICKLNTTQDKLILSVTDTGCGIPKSKHTEVFERFIKLDDYKSGNGLGLYISKLIISRLDGSINIDPTYTQGTRIVIMLPL